MSDSTLNALLSFPPHPPNPQQSEQEYDKLAKKHQESFAKGQHAHISGGVKSGESYLELLNPATNSISYLHVLLSHIVSSGTKGKAQNVSADFGPGKPFWLAMSTFMEQFDAVQIRYSGQEMRKLIELTYASAVESQQPGAAISPIRTAILRLDPSSSTFTSYHRFLPELCLLARSFNAALPVLDKDIFHFPNQTTKAAETTADLLAPYLCSVHESSSTYINTATALTAKLEYQDHLKYYLYGGMCYIGLKDWDRAKLFLEVVIMSPTQNIASKIQVEAYKKWILVSLLKDGKLASVPRTTNGQAVKVYTALASPYRGLAETFSRTLSNAESDVKIIAEAHEGQKIWSEDNNTGLVRQVISSFQYFSIRQLGDTYAALPLTEIASRTSHAPGDLSELGKYITDLIAEGKLNASLAKPDGADPSSWLLRFHDESAADDGPLSLSEQQAHDELTRQMEKVKNLMQHIREADRRFGLSKEYISEAKQWARAKESGEAGGSAGETWSVPMESAFDEDVMGD